MPGSRFAIMKSGGISVAAVHPDVRQLVRPQSKYVVIHIIIIVCAPREAARDLVKIGGPPARKSYRQGRKLFIERRFKE